MRDKFPTRVKGIRRQNGRQRITKAIDRNEIIGIVNKMVVAVDRSG
ncbi:MAG: hypothetical protein M3115_05090 [Thermoproteota archaeon]|nr:hypothetical protein [Thermoproteota archaeon]